VNACLSGSAAAFLAAAEGDLLVREAENSLILGIAYRLRDGGSLPDAPPLFAHVESEGRLRAAAVRTPPHRLVLAAHPADRSALVSLAEGLHAAGAVLPGAQGTVDAVGGFADRWSSLTGAEVTAGANLQLYRLRETPPWPRATGALRCAERWDVDLLSDWAAAFASEAVPHNPARDMRRFIESLIASAALFVWDDDGPVSMAASTRPTPNGISLNLVYTPPPHRRRGYASACVAALSRRMLASGRDFCTLFADLANPTSNRIYTSIGYRVVESFREVTFRSSPGPTG